MQAAVAASAGLLTIPDLYINLANVSLASEDYTDALRLYKVAMGKLDANKQSQVRGREGIHGFGGGGRWETGTDGTEDEHCPGTCPGTCLVPQSSSPTPEPVPPSCQVLLYLARGHYDSDDLRSAKQYLLRAIHIAPTDYKLRFNAALTMQVGGGGRKGVEKRQAGLFRADKPCVRVFPPFCQPHTFAPHSASQEWAVRVYRKVRPANDPTRVVEYRQAQEDLRQALK